MHIAAARLLGQAWLVSQASRPFGQAFCATVWNFQSEYFLAMIFRFHCSLIVWAPNRVPSVALVFYRSEKSLWVLSSPVGLSILVSGIRFCLWVILGQRPNISEEIWGSYSPIWSSFSVLQWRLVHRAGEAGGGTDFGGSPGKLAAARTSKAPMGLRLSLKSWNHMIHAIKVSFNSWALVLLPSYITKVGLCNTQKF
jgi:hypothetical protein